MLASASTLIAEPRTRDAPDERMVSHAPSLGLLRACELAADWLTCAGLVFAAQWVQLHVVHSTPHPLQRTLSMSVFVASLVTALLYRGPRSHAVVNPLRITAAAVRASFQVLILLLPAFYISDHQLPRTAILLSVAGLPIGLMIQHRLFAAALRHLELAKFVTKNFVLYARVKRTLDILASAILLLLLSPLFFLIAVLIRLTSPGPALFVQKRVGLNGRLFRMYKFRSMACTAPRYERSPRSSDDPRITRIGRLLRRTSIDELPQLMNVLLGDMSLVGPRPEMPFIARRYNARERGRLRVAPGITGLWQLSSDRPFPIHENLHHDLFYIRHRSLSLDTAILLHTLFFAMRRGV